MQDQLKSEDVQFGIIGLGLIGGSIAKSLSANKFEVFAEDSNQSYFDEAINCLLYTSPSPRDRYISRMPSSA